jgi:hypothetical protein
MRKKSAENAVHWYSSAPRAPAPWSGKKNMAAAAFHNKIPPQSLPDLLLIAAERGGRKKHE